MKPYLEDPDLTLYNGDALEVLQSLPSGSVHMCVTSPPFYGLRDYGTGSWVGGNPDCDHTQAGGGVKQGLRQDGREHEGVYEGERYAVSERPFGATCGKCGARRVDQQIGLEETPEQWVEKLVAVFREVRRVLRVDGTCWVEVGDSYATGQFTRQGKPRNVPQAANGYAGEDWTSDRSEAYSPHGWDVSGLKPKDLIGAPWMLAFALRADGWYLRSDIVWSRPNPMPESVTDRPTKSHSYVFLLSKSARYFFDQEAVREPHTPGYEYNGRSGIRADDYDGQHDAFNHKRGELAKHREYNPAGRNVRSVWQIATQPYPEAHFATYPEELVRRCILAGTSERGCCPQCGAPWTRISETTLVPSPRHAVAAGDSDRTDGYVDRRSYTDVKGAGSGDQGAARSSTHVAGLSKQSTTLGWRPSCGCDVATAAEDLERARKFVPIPCTVLDPFFGSGTTGLVARKHGRRTIGIELSESYCGLAGRRLQQLSLLAGVEQP